MFEDVSSGHPSVAVFTEGDILSSRYMVKYSVTDAEPVGASYAAHATSWDLSAGEGRRVW